MKARELIVSCIYTNDGYSVQELIYSFFAVFLKRELGKLASMPLSHI